MSRAPTIVFGICAVAAVGFMALLIAGSLPLLFGNGNGKQLQRVKGTIGYATLASAADFKPVFGKFDLPDDDWAVTQGASTAQLALPDSSIVSLGENTKVQVGAFRTDAGSPGSTMVLAGGSLRFDIHRPQSGAANYRFVTTTASVVVHGAEGVLTFLNGTTSVNCTACATDSVAVTAGRHTAAPTTGQVITISAAGKIGASENVRVLQR